MAISLGIHVPPDANPINLRVIIDQLHESDRVFKSDSEMLSYLSSFGVAQRNEISSTASRMGITEKTDEGVRLSNIGHTIANMPDEVVADIFHFCLYAGWQEKSPRDFLPSWAYRLCCDQYWTTSEVILSTEYLNQQVAETISLAYDTFPQLGVEDFEDISFSRKSITGIHKWLDALDPSVVNQGSFKRRSFCHPELVALAIGYAFRDDPQITEIDVLLTPDKQDIINKVCLLEPNSLDRVIDWTISVFPNLFQKGTKSGFYGRFLRIKKLPSIEDLIR